MEKECTSIKKNAISLSWYMRGGISYEDILNMSSEERAQVVELVNNNLETTKKSGQPFF
jgi:RNase P/RNase MRP subunit p30